MTIKSMDISYRYNATANLPVKVRSAADPTPPSTAYALDSESSREPLQTMVINREANGGEPRCVVLRSSDQGGVVAVDPDSSGPGHSPDLNKIRSVILAAQNKGGNTDNPAEQVFVDRNGDVILGSDAGDTTQLSSVAGDTFYTHGQTPDLNAIQRAVLAAQNKGGNTDNPAEQVFVDRNGDVILGSDAGDTTQLSSVAGDTFYTGELGFRDVASEREFVRTKMPRNTVATSDGDFDGYAYTITNRLGDSYTLFLYWSYPFGCYRVSLVSPRLGGQLDVHGGHLYSDNTLCLTRKAGSGYPSIEKTYAKAGLWTLGASLFRRGYGFQFNIGQDGSHRA